MSLFRTISSLVIAPPFQWLVICGAEAQVSVQVLKSFDGATGSQPYSQIIEGSDGALYGTTFSGGSNSTRGTIFKVSKDGSDFEVLRHLANGAGGNRPAAGLIEGRDGMLYGTTAGGGTNGQFGVLFKIRKDGSDYVAFKHFTGVAADGRQPQTSLIEGSDGLLYGTTYGAGTTQPGNVFRIAKDGTGYTVLHSFEGTADGKFPWGELLEGSDGFIYGTTYSGTTGRSLFGTIFKVNKDGNGYTILRYCDLATGSYPYGGLTETPDGVLYGTTSGGGTSGNFGTIFKINKDGSGHSIIHSFTGDGSEPRGRLAIGPDGMLYGTTFGGGIGTNGTVFKIHRDGGNFTLVRRFEDSTDEPRKPSAGVLITGSGEVYGTTVFGGSQNLGTVFRLSTTTQGPITLSITRQINGYLLGLNGGVPGKTYLIQARTNLNSLNAWSVIGSNSADASGRTEYLDTESPGHSRRLYRGLAP